MIPEQFILLIFIGLIGGIAAGFLGVGGGLLFVPIFSIILGDYAIPEDQMATTIIAHSSCLTLLTSLSGSLKHYFSKNFFLKETLTVALPGLIISFLLSNYLNQAEWYNQRIFSLVFSIIVIAIVIKMVFQKNAERSEESKPTPNFKYFGTGVIGAIIAAFSGVGGGIVMVPLLTIWAKKKIKVAASISLGTIVFLSLGIVINYTLFSTLDSVELKWQAGRVSFYLVALIAPGVILGAPIGVSLAKKAKPSFIRAAFLAASVIALVKMLFFGS